MKFNFRILSSFVLVLALVAVQVPLSVTAASLNTLSDTMSSLKASTASNHTIVFTTPTGIAASATSTVTFPAGFTLTGVLFSDIDVLDDGVDVTLAAAPSGATWGALVSGQVLTLVNGSAAVAVGSVVTIKIGTNATNQTTGVNRITNPTAGSYAITIGGSFGDTGTITTNIVSDDTVSVSATVAQSISFAISTTTLNFGTLDSASARFASSSTGSASDTIAHTLAIGTNAASGYAITVIGATLTSEQNASNTITAIGASPAASSVGTEQFGIYATKAGGSNGTIATPYATASSFGYNATATSSATFASGTSATATETYSLHYLANIAALTEAGTYSTNLTYVATANF